MESFIRSKYESRRWALEGPPPADPSVLDNGSSSAPAPVTTSPPPPAQQQQSLSSRHAPSQSFSSRTPAAPPVTTRQPQAHQLLSSNYTNRPVGVVPAPVQPAQPTPPPAQQQPQAPVNDLFSLDFHAPATPVSNTTSPEPKKDLKQNILSLYSSPPSATAATPVYAQFANQNALWGQPQQPIQQQQQQVHPPVTSMMGTNGAGQWGVSSGWSAAPAVPAQTNVWGVPGPASQIPPQQQSLFDTSSIWGSTSTPSAPAPAGGDLFGSFATQTTSTQKKDDVFGDIWGGFK